MRFKVGDRIKLINEEGWNFELGQEFEIVEASDRRYKTKCGKTIASMFDYYFVLVEDSAEKSGQVSPKDERKLWVELEIDCLESQARRYKTKLTRTEARLEAYREFLEMLEQE